MYAALVLSASLVAGDHLRELFPPVFRAMAALGLAFAVARPDGRFDRWAVAFIVWFGIAGVVVVGGQLWQRYVPQSDELRILIDPLLFGVSLASEALLALAGLTLFAARRATT